MSKSQSISVMKNYHDCDLIRGSESCLPGLPTHSAKCSKWWRQMKKYMILDKHHRKAKRVFRSHFAIISERMRHASLEHGFVIHPLSIFAIYREHLICVLWMIMFNLDPYNISFYHASSIDSSAFYFKIAIDFLLLINVFLEFNIGYCLPITKEIVLNPKKICLRYLRTYFLIDFFSCIPYYFILKWNGINLADTRLAFIDSIKLIRLFRRSTMSSFMIDLFAQFRMSESVIKWVEIFLMTLYIVHWWACAFHGLPILWFNGYKNLPETSWIMKAELYKNDTFIGPVYRYMVSILTATSHFYGSSEGGHYFEENFEKLMASLCLISGFAYCTYFVAHFLQIFGSINIADSKYDELVYQLEEYSRAKKLPEELQHRLTTYYEYKFQKKFFMEDAILNTLSEHLRFEILLYNCRHIVEKVMALQGLSKNVVGSLIANFKLEVYLQNDVIIKYGDPPLKMYFISHGTVAVYWSNGQEITHHEDGDFFGSVQDTSIVNVVAAEITETFSMNVTDAKYIFRVEKEVADRMNKLQTAKQLEYRNLAQMVEDVDHHSVLLDLRKGYILERRRMR
ncbi:hypothetical protein HHI36_019934 [Cryptolaemus montrouzieri]|uniref:Cyclic nucleotide-binding domain-containing protein n=1 Tax=Cryptolaemus montrouzieri TaxID=559131 RepID=A0ABD2N9Y6_9CUCU